MYVHMFVVKVIIIKYKPFVCRKLIQDSLSYTIFLCEMLNMTNNSLFD